jgi:hypothetical protein
MILYAMSLSPVRHGRGHVLWHNSCQHSLEIYQGWQRERESSALPSRASSLPTLIMPSGSRILKRSNADDGPKQPKSSDTRSPPPPPRSEHRPRPGEPCPIPSTNPASQYTLLEKLGTGSFGVVYKGMHNETRQIVAIKQIGRSYKNTILQFDRRALQI